MAPSEVPAGNATREEWATYAREHLAATEEDLLDGEGKELGRDALRDKYTDKSGDPIMVVRYIGRADAREISKESWTSVGVSDQDTSRWEQGNAFRIPVGELSKGALEYLERDPELVVQEA